MAHSAVLEGGGFVAVRSGEGFFVVAVEAAVAAEAVAMGAGDGGERRVGWGR